MGTEAGHGSVLPYDEGSILTLPCFGNYQYTMVIFEFGLFI